MSFLPTDRVMLQALRTSKIRGVQLAIVVDNKDGEGNPGYRVKVKFPWLNEQETSFWARIAVPMGGSGRGTYVLPEIDDQVLVVFEHGDINRPIVVGSLWSRKQEPVEVNQSGKNNTKLIKSRSGHRIIFDDKEGAEKITIVDKTKKNKIVLDSVNKIVKIESDGDLEVIAKTNVIVHSNALKIGASDGVTGKGQSLLVHAQKTFGLKATSGITIGGGTTTINVSNAAAASVSGSGAGELGGAAAEQPKDRGGDSNSQAGGGGSGGGGRGGPGDGGGGGAGANAVVLAAAQLVLAALPKQQLPAINPVIDLPKGILVAVRHASAQVTRQAVTLRTDSAFDGTGKLSRSSAGVRAFTAATGGTEIVFDGADQFQGAQLTAGVTLYLEGSGASTAVDAETLTLTLQGGSRPAGPPAQAHLTVVDAVLDICEPRPAPGQEPTPLSFTAKRDPGRDLGVPRAKLIVQPLHPDKAAAVMVLSALDAKVQLFSSEQAKKGESPIPLPREISAAGETFWVGASKLSSEPKDTGFKLALKGLADEADLVRITVVPSIRAANGIDDPPTCVPIANDLTIPGKTERVKLKVVPDPAGGGSFSWATTSALITLDDANKQVVTVIAGKSPSTSAAAETVSVTFTPTGKSALPSATHKLGVTKVTFSPEVSHPYGYDPYEKISCLDGNNKAFDDTPDPKLDFVSVESKKSGKVTVTIEGALATDIFFAPVNASVAKPATAQVAKTPDVLQIDGGAVSKDETRLRALVGSPKGPAVAELGVVTLKSITYKAEFFRVKDSASPTSALTLSVASADLKTACDDYYKQAVATFDITGGATELDVGYDANKDGVLNLEPGTTTSEQKKVIAKCTSKKQRVIQIHSIKWNYYLTGAVKATDTSIQLKNYGATYLGYIGTNTYEIRDNKGNSANITVKSVNTATGKVELTAAIGQAFILKDKPSLVYPLSGMSGDPLFVTDKDNVAKFAGTVAHELGHTLGGMSDISELDNIMYGQTRTRTKLRHRKLKQYYDTSKTEGQWMKMKGR